MKNRLVVFALILALVFVGCVSAYAIVRRTPNIASLKGLTVGTGDYVSTGGDFTIKNSSGTSKFTITASSGATTIVGAATLQNALLQTLTNAAGGSANPYDYTATLGIMDGTDTFQLFDVNITNADHTGSTNVVEVMNIANITGDTHAQENAFTIGSGWDVDVNAVTSLELGADNTAVVTIKDPAAAGSGQDLIAIAGTLAAANGSDTSNALSLTLTNANHSSTGNVVNGLYIAGITADADATETAINIATGWDSAATIAYGAGADSATTNNGIDLNFTTPVDTTGTNSHNAINIDTTIGNASGGTNVARAVNIANITGDAQVTETAVNIGTGWDNAILAGSPVTLTSIAASDSLTITGTALTTGDAISVSAVDATLNGGLYLNLLGGTGSTAVFTVGEDGATAISSTAVATNSFSITNNASTSGDLVTLTLDDDTADSDVFYISCLGGTDHATSVFTLGEGGVASFKGGATVDNATDAAILNLTETTVKVTGALNVTGAVNASVWDFGTSTSTATIDATWYGKTTLVSPGDDNGVLTVPTPVGVTAGTWFRVLSDTAGTLTFTGAANDLMTTAGNATADGVSVTDISASLVFIATGSKWFVLNESTVTVTAIDP